MRGSRILAIAVLAVTLLAPAIPASADHRSGPCNIHQRDDETVQDQMRRIIRCAVDLWDVPGGADKAICIAVAESGLDPKAVSAGGDYLGLYQHGADAWPDRYDEWTRPKWELNDSALSGRTNAIVTIRMVRSYETWPDAGWTVKGCR